MNMNDAMETGEALSHNQRSASSKPETTGTGVFDIEVLKAGLRELKSSRKPTKIELIRDLMAVINEMLATGVLYADIASYLSENGIEISEGSLKSTLSKVRKDTGITTCKNCGNPIKMQHLAADTSAAETDEG